MTAIRITNEQRIMATASGIDSDNAYADGILDQDNNQCQPPIDGYSSLPTDIRDTTKKASEQMFALMARYFAPIAANATGTGGASFTSETQIASLAIKTYVSRKVLFTLNFGAYVTSISTKLVYRIKVNGTQVGPDLPYFFNAASDHRSIGGTWVGSLVAGDNTVTAHVVRSSGSGTITMDGNDVITLSVIG